MNKPRTLVPDIAAKAAKSLERGPNAAGETARHVIRMVTWDDTPEGHEYWQAVYEKLLVYAENDQ